MIRLKSRFSTPSLTTGFRSTKSKTDTDSQISYFESRLKPASAKLADGHDVVCAFVNDDLGAETIELLIKYGVKLIAMRCAGFNNVDLGAAANGWMWSVFRNILRMRLRNIRSGSCFA